MIAPTIPLIAHFKNPKTGDREASLPVIAVQDAGGMLVLFQNKLVGVHSKPMGLELDLIEVVQTSEVKEIFYPKAKPKKTEAAAKAVEPKQEETK